MEKLIEIGKNMELEGQNLLNFVKEQQKIQIQERSAEREAAKAKIIIIIIIIKCFI